MSILKQTTEGKTIMKIIDRNQSKLFEKRNPYIHTPIGSETVIATIATPTGRVSKYLCWYTIKEESDLLRNKEKLTFKLEEWLNGIVLNSIPDGYSVMELVNLGFENKFKDVDISVDKQI